MPITCTKCGTAKVVRKRTVVAKGQLERVLVCPRCQLGAVRTWKARRPEKAKAHRLVASAKKAGRIEPQPCEVCGSLDGLNAHHDDYAKPLAVRWLCRRHHFDHHQDRRRRSSD